MADLDKLPKKKPPASQAPEGGYTQVHEPWFNTAPFDLLRHASLKVNCEGIAIGP